MPPKVTSVELPTLRLCADLCSDGSVTLRGTATIAEYVSNETRTLEPHSEDTNVVFDGNGGPTLIFQHEGRTTRRNLDFVETMDLAVDANFKIATYHHCGPILYLTTAEGASVVLDATSGGVRGTQTSTSTAGLGFGVPKLKLAMAGKEPVTTVHIATELSRWGVIATFGLFLPIQRPNGFEPPAAAAKYGADYLVVDS